MTSPDALDRRPPGLPLAFRESARSATKALLLLAAAVGVALIFGPPAATAGEKKPAALVSGPLSINPNDGQPICLVTNLSEATTITVSVEIFDATGASVAITTSDVPPGAVDATTDLSLNFYTYCRITPLDPAQLPLLRGSHCSATGNHVGACVEAR